MGFTYSDNKYAIFCRDCYASGSYLFAYQRKNRFGLPFFFLFLGAVVDCSTVEPPFVHFAVKFRLGSGVVRLFRAVDQFEKPKLSLQKYPKPKCSQFY
jgi:hypothetical protein